MKYLRLIEQIKGISIHKLQETEYLATGSQTSDLQLSDNISIKKCEKDVYKRQLSHVLLVVTLFSLLRFFSFTAHLF